MAGTVVITQTEQQTPLGFVVHKIRVDWTGDAANGSVPNTVIPKLHGFVMKAVTIPGATAPTATYSIKLFDPDAAALDAFVAATASRSASAAEQVAPVLSGAQTPVFLCGDYTFNVSGNSVNNATGSLIIYLRESI